MIKTLTFSPRLGLSPGSLLWFGLVLLGGVQPAGGQQSGDAIGRLVPPVPTPASFIADIPGVLSVESHAAADQRIRALQTAGLGDIGVAILPSIDGYAPDQVGVAIYRTWKIGSRAEIGSAHRDVGLLLLIVPKELAPDKVGRCWITTGTGAEGIVTDAASGSICRDVVIPLLKEKRYGDAVLAGIGALEARLHRDEGLTTPGTGGQILPPTGTSSRNHWWPIPVGLLALFPLGAAIRRWRRFRVRNCPKCGRPMVRLDEKADDAQLNRGQQVEEEISSIDYDVWQCTCGEHLTLPYKKLFSRYHTCRECKNRTAWSTRRILFPATTVSSGSAEDTWRCKACPATWVTHVVLPRIQTSSSSSSGGGGGGGGSSFGGSGSTGGGGGGGSY